MKVFQEGRIFKVLSLLAVPYVMSVTIAWALGYWRTFGVNPFEYAEPTEIASLSAYALVASLSVLVIAAFLARMFIQGPVERALDTWIENRIDRKLGAVPQPPSGVDCEPEKLADYRKKINDFDENLRRMQLWLFLRRVFVAFGAILAAYLAYLQQSQIWLGVFVISPVVAVLAADPIPEKIKDALSRNVTAEIMLCVMLSLPVISFLYGAQKAFQIRDGAGTMFLFDGEDEEQFGALYVGRMGDFIFTFNVCSKYLEVKNGDKFSEFNLVPHAVVQCSESMAAQQGAAADR